MALKKQGAPWPYIRISGYECDLDKGIVHVRTRAYPDKATRDIDSQQVHHEAYDREYSIDKRRLREVIVPEAMLYVAEQCDFEKEAAKSWKEIDKERKKGKRDTLTTSEKAAEKARVYNRLLSNAVAHLADNRMKNLLQAMREGKGIMAELYGVLSFLPDFRGCGKA